MRIRVAMITHGMQAGGTRTHIRNFAWALNQASAVDVTVICLYPGKVANYVLAAGVKVWSPSAWERSTTEDMCRQVAVFLHDESFDLAHTHDSYGGTVGRYAAIQAGLPIVHTHHIELRKYVEERGKAVPRNETQRLELEWMRKRLEGTDFKLNTVSKRLIAVSAQGEDVAAAD